MKKQLYLLILAWLGITACSDWLDVTPRYEIKESVMFSSEEGFKTALTGVYLQLADAGLYGKNTSFFFPELLTQHWEASNELNEKITQYNYTHRSVETLIDGIWRNYYTAIANLNNIIHQIEDTRVSFSFGNDSIIYGEALGLRGFLHLEVLRLFGPSPKDAGSSDKVIPYVTEMGKDPQKQTSLTYGEVTGLILSDLTKAEKLLAVDPLRFGSNRDLNVPGSYLATYIPDDEWHYYRQRRFNYYAVKAAKARYYLWVGEKQLAVAEAKEIIETTNEDGSLKFNLADNSEYSGVGVNLVMQSEQLFGVINDAHQNIVQGLFKGEAAELTQTREKTDQAFEINISPDDIRHKYYWQVIEHEKLKVNHFWKYTGSDKIAATNIVPVLRLSEMYLILMECLPVAEALEYFKTYRLSRNLNSSLEDLFHDEAAIRERLEKEYRKEFYGEGQMFFFYKRLRYERLNWPQQMEISPAVYRIPIPQSQTVFE